MSPSLSRRRVLAGIGAASTAAFAGPDSVAPARASPSQETTPEADVESLVDDLVETPIRFTSDGAVEITFLGTDEAFAELFDDADAGFGSVELLDTGDFDPEESSFSRAFTARQEEVLAAAVELGYYREPRQATLEDVGDAVGIAPATAGEHLRKIEERVFTELAR